MFGLFGNTPYDTQPSFGATQPRPSYLDNLLGAQYQDIDRQRRLAALREALLSFGLMGMSGTLQGKGIETVAPAALNALGEYKQTMYEARQSDAQKRQESRAQAQESRAEESAKRAEGEYQATLAERGRADKVVSNIHERIQTEIDTESARQNPDPAFLKRLEDLQVKAEISPSAALDEFTKLNYERMKRQQFVSGDELGIVSQVYKDDGTIDTDKLMALVDAEQIDPEEAMKVVANARESAISDKQRRDFEMWKHNLNHSTTTEGNGLTTSQRENLRQRIIGDFVNLNKNSDRYLRRDPTTHKVVMQPDAMGNQQPIRDEALLLSDGEDYAARRLGEIMSPTEVADNLRKQGMTQETFEADLGPNGTWDDARRELMNGYHITAAEAEQAMKLLGLKDPVKKAKPETITKPGPEDQNMLKVLKTDDPSIEDKWRNIASTQGKAAATAFLKGKMRDMQDKLRSSLEQRIGMLGSGR